MANIVLKDRVKETTSTAGTSNFVLGGSVSGYDPFSVIGANNYTYYCCYDSATGDWEVGYGQYTTTAGGTLVRDTVLDNSAQTTSKISFAAGPKDLFITYPAAKAIYEEETGQTLINGGPITIVGTGVTGYTEFDATIGQGFADLDSYAQFYVQNLNDGVYASSDFVAYNDLTTDGEQFYVDMGINSSNFADAATYPIFPKSSAYLYSAGVDGGTVNQNGDLYIGTGTAPSDLVFFTGGLDTTNIRGAIKSGGNWLIGKYTDSGEKFQVSGTANISGATTFGSTVTLNADPSAALQAATKQYVDNATSTGIHIHTAVTAETSSALSAVYTQGGTTFNITDITGTNTVVTSTTHGLSVNDQIWLYTSAGNGLSINTPYFVYATPTTTSLQLSTSYGGTLLTGLTNASGLTYATRANSGVGAYLEASANQALPISGVTTSDRVLVYNQATGYWNGVYTVTSLGSVGSKWKLTRATDADYYSPSDVDGLSEGDYFFVQSNSESYVLTTPGSIIIGYTGITYTLFSASQTYTGTAPINVSGGVIALTGTVAATNGGTGLSSYVAGDIVYATSTSSLSALSVGTQYQSLLSTGTAPTWGGIPLNEASAVAGALRAVNGGTGQSGYSVGDMLYSGVTDTLSKLAGNTTTTKKFLGQTGTGTVSQAPSWQQPAATDITGLAPSATTDTTNASNITSGTLGTARLSGSYTGITGVGTLTAGTWNAAAIGPTYGGTGFSSYAVGDLLYADTTTSLAKLADVAVGNALISGGTSSAPAWGKIGLSTHVSGTLPVANGGTGVTASTGSGNVVLSNSPTLVTPDLGTPSSVTLTSATGLPLSTGVTGTLPVANGGTGVTTSTGSGNVVLSTSPTLTTPTIGVATATSVNKVAFTAPATGSTLTIADGKTLTANNTITFSGTDSTTMTFPPASANVGYLNVPQNSQSAAYTAVLSDSGKHIYHPSTDANARTFTIPANSSVAYEIGTVLTFINMTSQVVTISITTDTMYLAGTGTTGNRSLAQYGIATAIKMTTTTWLISGTGLT